MAKVYSFQEVSLVLNHPECGMLTISGKGAGSVKVSMAAERTEKQVASDGVVVFSKIRDRSGQLDISIFNTSDFHKELKKWFNYLEQADAASWALISATLSSKSTNEGYKCSGVAFSKMPDAEYGATASMVDWSMQVADLQHNIS